LIDPVSPLARRLSIDAHAHDEDGHQDVLGHHQREDGRKDAEGAEPAGDHDRDGRGQHLMQTHAKAPESVVIPQAEARRRGRRG
jgi:hypothetical protein